MGIPCSERLSGLDLLAVLHLQCRTIRHLMTLTLTTIFVLDHGFAITRYDHLLVTRISYIAHCGAETYHAVGFTFDLADRSSTRYRTTDVERTHGQLRSWLADGLRGNHTYGLAHVDQAATAQIATIALGTNTI